MGDEDDKLLSLIDACLQGKEEAWHAFVHSYGKVVRGCLLGYFRDSAEKIDDVTQQVFIKLWKAGLRAFRGTNRYQFLSYLKQITINEAKTYFRLTGGQNSEVSLNQDPESGGMDVSVGDIASEAPSPEETTIVAERLKLLTNHLHDLSLEHQQIFLMKLKGYKDKEIAQLLAIAEGTVASGYSRTLERLKKSVKRDS